MTDHLFDAYGRRWGLYCVSAGRPANVIPTKFLWEGLSITWVVPAEEAREYKAAGAQRVIPVTRKPGVMPLGDQRNAALEDAFLHGATCIQTDDDGKRLLRWQDGKAVPATATHYLNMWDQALRETPGARLAGCAPLANAFYSTGKIRTQHWIMAQVFAVEPSTPRFDPDTCPREDYDFTAQHLEAYGAVARHDGLLPDFRHWGNRGGCQDWRTDERSKRVNALLLSRWPQYLRENTKRPGELLFRAPPRAVVRHAALPGGDLPLCGAPVGARVAAPGERYDCGACKARAAEPLATAPHPDRCQPGIDHHSTPHRGCILR